MSFGGGPRRHPAQRQLTPPAQGLYRCLGPSAGEVRLVIPRWDAMRSQRGHLDRWVDDPAAEDEGHGEEDQEHEEEDLGDGREVTGESAEAEDAGDQGEDGKRDGPT